ncbi:hypothetical protein TrVGV298_004670 [Trichoderma virens]|nr:hypothetical protein TrVGV298_004670 [Trichoderma virens]
MRLKDQTSTNFETSLQTSAPDDSITAGIKTKMEEKRLDSEEFDKSSDFVFAYRLNEIRYRRTVTHKPYSWGRDVVSREAINIPFGADTKTFKVIAIPRYEDLECYVGKDIDE